MKKILIIAVLIILTVATYINLKSTNSNAYKSNPGHTVKI